MIDMFSVEQLAYFGVALLFLIFFIISLSGKGGMLIAGYNTASKEKKAKYDEKKLVSISSISYIICAATLVLGGLNYLDIKFVGIICFCSLFGLSILAEFFSKKK